LRLVRLFFEKQVETNYLSELFVHEEESSIH
ncbi:hypothetical protein EZS27_028105, partial [termite gut metagenome]